MQAAPGNPDPGAPAAAAAPEAPAPSPPAPAAGLGPVPVEPFEPRRLGTRAWLPALQSLRGVAALWVVLYHVDVQYWALGQPLLWTGIGGVNAVGWIRFGWLGVDLFFVLSAFLLARPFLRGDPPRYMTFLRERLLRIAPAYYAALIAAAALLLFVLPYGMRSEAAWPSLLFLSNLAKPWHEAINPAFWSLAVEVQFYVLLPLLVRPFMGRHSAWWLAAFITLGIGFRAAAFQWLGSPDPASPLAWLGGPDPAWFASTAGIWGSTFWLPAFLGHFALGIAAARIRQVKHPGWLALASLPLIIVPCMLWIPDATDLQYAVSFGYSDLAAQTLVRPIVAVGFALLVLAAASEGFLARLLALRPLRALGTMSYSLYLIHIPAILLAFTLQPTLGRTGTTAAAILLSLLAGIALYAAAERPAEAWRHRRRRREGATA